MPRARAGRACRRARLGAAGRDERAAGRASSGSRRPAGAPSCRTGSAVPDPSPKQKGAGRAPRTRRGRRSRSRSRLCRPPARTRRGSHSRRSPRAPDSRRVAVVVAVEHAVADPCRRRHAAAARAGANLAGSIGQPSLQSSGRHASLSVSVMPQPHWPGAVFSGSFGQPSRAVGRAVAVACRCPRRRSRTRPARSCAGSLGQPSLQSGVPSPSVSVSATPQPHDAGRGLARRRSGSRRCSPACRRRRCRYRRRRSRTRRLPILAGVGRAAVVAVGRAVAVAVGVGDAAAADAGRDLGRIARAAVVAVRRAVAVACRCRRRRSRRRRPRSSRRRSGSRRCSRPCRRCRVSVSATPQPQTPGAIFAGSLGQPSLQSARAVAVGVGVGHAAAADARRDLRGVARAAVVAVRACRRRRCRCRSCRSRTRRARSWRGRSGSRRCSRACRRRRVSVSATPQPQTPGAILRGIARAAVVAVRRAVAVAVGVGDAAAADARLRSSPDRSGSRRCSPACRRRPCRCRPRRSRRRPARSSRGSLGQPSLQSAVPSPSRVGVGDAAAAGARLRSWPASLGQPSLQSAVPSPSLSVSATPQPQTPGATLRRRRSGSRRCSRPCRRRRCPCPRTPQPQTPRRDLGRVVRAAVVAVGVPSPSRVGVGHAAAAHARARSSRASFGQPSLQSAVPSPSLSASRRRSRRRPARLRRRRSGSRRCSSACRRRRCRCPPRRSRTRPARSCAGPSGSRRCSSAVPSPSLSVSAHAAAAGARRDLRRIARAAVVAIRGVVPVAVGVGPPQPQAPGALLGGSLGQPSTGHVLAGKPGFANPSPSVSVHVAPRRRWSRRRGWPGSCSGRWGSCPRRRRRRRRRC